MKKLFLVMAFLCSAFWASAQTKVTWSAEVGVGMSTWIGDGSDGATPLLNPRVGVGIDVPLNGLVSFKTGLSWVSKGAKGEEGTLKVKVNQNYFQMPLLAAFHLGTAAKFDMVLTGGAYIAYGAKGKTSVEVGDVDVAWDTFDDVDAMQWKGVRRFDAGLQAGVAFDFPKWTVGLEGQFGLCRIQSYAPHNLALLFAVGYKF